MTEQTLPFVHPRNDKATKLDARMRRVLADGRWHTAADLGMSVLGLDERTARVIAERSEGRIIGSDLGYRLIQFASVDEIDHVEQRLRSQARRMLRRVVEIRRARNSCPAQKDANG
jgi:hypothetical protein